MAKKKNSSGRKTKRYPTTKSDPICKWRVASIATVINLVDNLPKEILKSDIFRDRMKECYDGHFFRNAYQLALQLGLYYENNGYYIPRFDCNITEKEALTYMQKWMKLYYVPNPYTRKGFTNVVPSVYLLNAIANYLEENPNKPNLATAGAALFGGEMGNIGCVKHILNNYSNIIKVDKNNDMFLLTKKNGKINVENDRDDKKAFFEHFK